ncbi:S-layer homology domain-containing protein [Paenibacillus bouchesdurhonensis]|uniref:S-layer homology domain-containing protein n=1 Tax=Paenibacillus bouchesdurhonensis TaxID=1870990 RepID=UPI001F1F4310|nr:S-layer homology domain-containing protein [Paenibacillus bouchesdurhonensis]
MVRQLSKYVKILNCYQIVTSLIVNYSQELIITIEELLDTAHLENDGEVFASPVFELLSNISGNFNKPVTLTFKYDPSKVENGQYPVISYCDEENKKWVNIGGQVDGDTISIDVEYFAKFAVLVIDEESVPEMPKEEITFTDISRHWAEAQIRQAVEQGTVSGYPDGTFKPNSRVTRAEFTLMLMNAINSRGESTELRFGDVQEIGTWAQTAVAQSAASGIVTGYSDGTFRPNASITRAEMAAMIARALKLQLDTNVSTGFSDDEAIPQWAKGSIEAIRELSIVNGRGGNRFVPDDTATRAEAAVMLLRMLEVNP